MLTNAQRAPRRAKAASLAAYEQRVDQLIARSKAGDQEAAGELIAHYRKQVLALARRMLQNRQPAGMRPSDIAQDTSERAVRHFSQFRGSSTVEVEQWLFTIARSVILQAFRLAGTEKRGTGKDLPLDGVGELRAQSGLTPIRLVSERQDWRRVLTAMFHLPNQQREALRLRFMGSLSVKEVAIELGCSPQAVEGLLKRGLMCLHDELGNDLTVIRTNHQRRVMERSLREYLALPDDEQKVNDWRVEQGSKPASAAVLAFIGWVERFRETLRR